MRENRYLRDRMINRNMGDYRSRDSRGRYMPDRTHGDYRMNDYGRDYYDYDMAEDEFKQGMEMWCRDLKHMARTPIAKADAIKKAEQMGVRFDEYDEDEFYVTTMMLMSDFPNMGQPETYIVMAKQWLEDKDSALKGSEKLSAYYYTIVKGE